MTEQNNAAADKVGHNVAAAVADLEDVGRLIAIGRRQGIEAALEIVKQWPPHMVVTTIQAMLEDKP